MSDLGLELGNDRRHRPRRSFGCLAVLLALVVLVGGGYFAVSVGMTALRDRLSASMPRDYTGDGTGSVLFRVREGEAATDIGSRLARKDIVASLSAFTRAARENEESVGIQVGYYRLRHRMSAESALAVLVDPGNLLQQTVTIPEGLTVEETLRRLAKETDFNVGRFRRALRQPRRLGLPAYARGNPEGYLFPATYELSPKATPKAILEAMLARYHQSVRTLDLTAKARALGYSPHDVMTVASLVQAEARFGKDFNKVSRVIYNRLDARMPLQFDSTVKYAVGKNGSVGTSDADRATASPYNTYLHPGLPPTPISAPGEQAIRAALNPAAGTWLYFVTTNPDTGETKFATSYAQHLRNKAEFDRWCARSDHC